MLTGLFEPETDLGASLGRSSYRYNDVYTKYLNGQDTTGKVLSTNDYTSTEKENLSKIKYTLDNFEVSAPLDLIITDISTAGYHNTKYKIAFSELDPSYLSSAVPVSKGGTGATSASSARSNLGLGSAATYSATSSVTSGSSSLVTSGGVYSATRPTDISSSITISSSNISYSSSTKIGRFSAVAGIVSVQIEIVLSAALAQTTTPKTVATISSSYAPSSTIVGTATDSGNKTAFSISVTPSGSIQLYGNPAISSGSYLRLNATWCV